MNKIDEQNNSKWRRKKEDDKEVENVERKKIEIYSTSTEILPILEGPETVNTSIPSTISPLLNTTYNESSDDIKENFESVDTSALTNTENIHKDPFKWVKGIKDGFLMVILRNFAKFNPTIITHNKYTDRFLKYLAEKDIANAWLDDTSNYVNSYKTPTVEDSTNTISDLSDSYFESKMNKMSENANNYKTKVISDASNTLHGKKDDILSQLEDSVKCDDSDNKGRGGINIQNADLALDIALIKDYMFKTILLIISFITVSSWAYLFLVYYSKQPSFFQKIVQSAISEDGLPDFSKIPIIGVFLDVIMKGLRILFNMFNPFDMAARGTWTMNDILKQIGHSDMNDVFDKKIWYIFIFYCVFISTTFFIENYHSHMNDVVNLKTNNITTFFWVLFILFYIWDVSTYPTKMSNMTEMAIGAVLNIPYLIFLLLRNIFTLYCLYYNQFLILFIMIMLFILISLFGLFMFPVFNPGKMFDRYRLLYDVVNKNVEEKLKLDELDPYPNVFNRIYRIIRTFLHFFYDHLFSISSILWVLYMYYIFDRKLKNDLLRMNVFTMLAVSILLLIMLKMIEVFFFNKK